MKKIFMLFAFAVLIESGLNLSLDPGEENHFSRQTQTILKCLFSSSVRPFRVKMHRPIWSNSFVMISQYHSDTSGEPFTLN